VRFDRFELDEANARLLRDGMAVALPPTPFAVLCALVRQPGSLLTTSALLDSVWGHQFVTDSVLRTAISELRTALDDDARKPRFIERCRGGGIASSPPRSAIVPPPGVQPTSRNRLRSTRPASSVAPNRSRGCGAPGTRYAAASARSSWVAGEPGIGKTTLIEQFIASLGDVTCARGQCVEHYGEGEPYLPVLEALAELCRKDSTLVSLLRAVAPTWLVAAAVAQHATSAKRCDESLPGSVPIACCARSARFSIARASAGHCCW
jgi:DNA-binding winged helix-turn-helix (wHTH) protein